MLRDIIKDYMETLKNIQELGENKTPYALDEMRNKLHRQILCTLSNLADFKDFSDAYIRSKTIFENLDAICEIFSSCEEWKLESDGDVSAMTTYLWHYLIASETLMYLEGRVNLPAHIRRLIEKKEIVDGEDTKLHIDKPVYAIHLANVEKKNDKAPL